MIKLKKKNIFIGLLVSTLTLVNLFGIFLWANPNNWIIKLNGNVLLNQEDLDLEYESFLEYQKLKNLFTSDDEIEELKKDPYQKKLFLYNHINDLLVMKTAKEKNLFDENVLNKKIDGLKNTLKRHVIKQIYINKLIKSKIESLDSSLVQETYEEILNDPNNKELSIQQKKKLAEERTLLKKVEEKFMESINDLKNQYQIQINDLQF